MTCSEIQSLLPDYALQMLDPRQAKQVADHLAEGCSGCQRELDELVVTLALLAEADAQTVVPPAELKTELLRRISGQPPELGDIEGASAGAASNTPRTREARTDTAPRSPLWWRAVLYVAATIAAFATGVAVHHFSHDPRETELDREAMYRARMAQIERSFDTTRVRMATLHTGAADTGKRGVAVWDPATRELHFYAFDVPQVAEDNVLVLWLVDVEGRHTAAGRLTLDSAGNAARVVEFPDTPVAVEGVVVTEEPASAAPEAGQSAKPSGPTRLTARFGD